ncbi:MAG: HNH endonuclease [Chlorobi bacterium]|nr:HNH endonuclease [Chlorobiota bacterium]
MNEYINKFLKIIRNCSVDNTYKMAWGRALVEISSEINNEKIHFSQIATKIFKYYWNQTIYFDLIQGSNISKPPEFITEVKKQIEIYYQKQGNRQPIRFERIESEINLNIKKLIKILKQDVSWRFLKLKKETISLYSYQKGNDYLILENYEILKEYSDILFEAINFRWTQILENFNSSPRIAKKVKILDLKEIKRNNLSKFRSFLDAENPNHFCFICNKKITNETPSIDHVIPWSFLFSDDLWNLVYTHKSCNSQKSNIIPSESEINKLEIRNNRLLKILESKNDKRKAVKELKIAIEKDYVRKFWISCKT